MRTIKLFIVSAFLFALSAAATGCSYGGIATTNDGHVVVTRNNMLLFGALREVFVCKVTPNGLVSCAKNEAP